MYWHYSPLWRNVDANLQRLLLSYHTSSAHWADDMMILKLSYCAPNSLDYRVYYEPQSLQKMSSILMLSKSNKKAAFLFVILLNTAQIRTSQFFNLIPKKKTDLVQVHFFLKLLYNYYLSFWLKSIMKAVWDLICQKITEIANFIKWLVRCLAKQSHIMQPLKCVWYKTKQDWND